MFFRDDAHSSISSGQCATTKTNRKFLSALSIVWSVLACAAATRAQSADSTSAPGAAAEPYPNMPSIAPIGVRIGRYLDVPASAQGRAVDPAKGYRLQELGSGLYMVTDNAY